MNGVGQMLHHFSSPDRTAMPSPDHKVRRSCHSLNKEPQQKHTYIYILVGGFNPSEKILVSWDHHSQYMENKMYVPNHQPVYIYIYVQGPNRACFKKMKKQIRNMFHLEHVDPLLSKSGTGLIWRLHGTRSMDRFLRKMTKL